MRTNPTIKRLEGQMILIDSREKLRKQDTALRELVASYVKSERMHLEVGDYLTIGITRSACIEAKSTEDYLSSIQSGILNEELRNMSNSYDKNILVVYGSLTEALFHRKSSRSSYSEYLAGCVVHESPLGKQSAISVVTFENIYDAALFIKSVHDIITRDNIFREPTARKLKLTPEEVKLGTFYSLPDIGKKRALDLKNKYKVLRNLANTTQPELESIPGIGKKIAQKVYQHFNEE